MVIVWDVGSRFLHGLYINAKDSMASGQVVKPYHGPQNTRPFANIYVFIALPQPNNQSLDYESVRNNLAMVLARGGFGQFDFESFYNMYFNYITLLSSHISLLQIPGDAMGARLAKR